MPVRRVFLILVTFLMTTACQSRAAPAPYTEVKSDVRRDRPVNIPEDDTASVAAGNNAFGLELYHAVDTYDQNLLLAPISLNMALAMTYAGARGATAAEMAQVLHYDLPPERLHPALGRLMATYAGWTDFDLWLANGLWLDDDTAPVADFLDLMSLNYDAGLYQVDFDNNRAAAVAAMNDWIAGATNDRFTDVIDDQIALPGTALVLINTIYFQAEWRQKFFDYDTRNEPFTRLNGRAINVPMMHQIAGMRYAETNTLQYAEHPYASGEANIVFAVILPAEGQFSAVANGLSMAELTALMAAAEYERVELHLPRFDFDTGNQKLGPVLEGMGLPTLFSLGANLSGMVSDDVMIGQVAHRANISLDEEKTEAAAVSVVEVTRVVTETVGEPPDPIVMDVNRPFIFFIYDRTNGVILFLGHLVAP